MRPQDKIIIWPAYFDSAKTRKNGRRVTKNLAVPSPKLLEIKEAAEKTGFIIELVEGSGYPKTPWLKNGMLLIKKKQPKSQIIMKIAKQLAKARSEAAAKQN